MKNKVRFARIRGRVVPTYEKNKKIIAKAIKVMAVGAASFSASGLAAKIIVNERQEKKINKKER